MSLISFLNVSKSFKTGRNSVVDAVKNVTLEIEEGEIFGIIGYSGAGKSTLVRMINGLEKPTAGEVVALGENIEKLSEHDLKPLRLQIGMVFQSFNLFNAKTVAQNIEFPLKLAGWKKKQRQTRVRELLEFVGLSDKGNTHPAKLSGGQKQRVGIARALGTNPKILLADEATSALDPETTLEVLRLLKRVNRELGVTIVVITHTMSVVRLLCDRVAVMKDGEIAEVDSVRAVFQNPKSEIAQKFVETFRIMEGGEL